MTRKEEIKCASKDYVNYLLDKQEYHNEKYTEYDIKQAFEKGAEWADKHPKNVWHDASEEPKLDQWFLAQIGDDAFDTFIMAMDKNKKWRNWCKGINIKRWAYISDLLPKFNERCPNGLAVDLMGKTSKQNAIQK